MAKTSKIAADRRRRETVARYAEQRAILKRTLKDPASTLAEKVQAQRSLQRLPRDASPTRLRNRDAIDGRPRGHLRTFGLSRVRFRAAAHRGELPGITKSSW
ncbi:MULTISPECIES: 30S ribosomal protein S14 [Brachybacterium]|uniref:Small ribosomal subunit protein uS14 n=1 Tax=Brachybacterium alimentarium TaxID=47845 RepID=A0A2A3YMQ2_9MICO|nr:MULTISPECIES: 30S ribosomal protein S14 [Brachybacterium]PCC32066.1 30S ribosomal protein S14 [Brachybacterium alimentarium]PCC40587.1 30S ribosomal protein S14 [Brachybacterium alimentarium]RCS61736.1 30S ribosomal protein S14 [Brachybacterium sp. JB7]RCS69595.1 30S ribosomal protein S14 [Brachybacterium alimentarium]RCS71483.1 30S ribosomal protein S14 [Brachybacterium alimentarium]